MTSKPESLYVNRPLLNADELIKWALEQGFKSTLPGRDMHVTLAFSRTPVSWDRLEPQKHEIRATGGTRSVEPLGEKGAVVLHFESPHLQTRWQEIRRVGASWDHDGYRPHITLTYEGKKLPLDEIEPYEGPLIFGPEEFEPLDQNWDQKVVEEPTVVENRAVLPAKISGSVKYGESIAMETNRMTEFSNLLMKNIDLILEAYEVDEHGNLVGMNKKKIAEADEVFHQYFVKSMNKMFRQINENDPIMNQPNGMGLPAHGHDDLGIGSHMGHDMDPMGAPHADQPHAHMMGDDNDMTGMYPHHSADMHGMDMRQGMNMHPHMESTESSDFDWLSEDIGDVDINAMFEIEEEEEIDEENLNEFGMGGEMNDDQDNQFGHMDDGSADMGGGANDMGGDMGGMADMGGDNMDLDSSLDGSDMGGNDDMGGDDMDGGDMVTVHGEFDNGSPFEFKFDPDDLGFGDDAGGGDEHHSEHGHEGHEDHGIGHPDAPGMGDDDQPPVAEASEHFHNGKPRSKKNGPKSARMGVVPANPTTRSAAAFPSPFPSGRHGK